MSASPVGTAFSTQAGSLVLVDLKDPANAAYLAPALEVLYSKHPDFDPKTQEDPELQERLDEQLADDGFAKAVWNPSTQKIEGVIAGVTMPGPSGPNTYAAITYTAHATDDADVQHAMLKSTQAELAQQGVQVIAVEATPREIEVMRDTFTRVPVPYEQGRNAGNDSHVDDLTLVASFIGQTTQQTRTDLIKGWFSALTDRYDAPDENGKRQNPENDRIIADFNKNLDQAAFGFKWNMTQGVGAPAPAAS